MIGLGKLGLPVAEVMAMYHDVVGFDINPRTATLPIAATLEEAIQARELIFVAIETPYDILDELNKIVTPDQIVVLISCCLKVREEFRPHITNCRLLYNPYLVHLDGDIQEEMLSPPMIIIGTDTGDLSDGDTLADVITIKGFYNSMMKNKPPCFVKTWETAEELCMEQ